MKLSEMKAIAESRENLVAFLHHTDIATINANLIDFNADKKSFIEICQETLEQYKLKKISNKNASTVFEILAYKNKNIKTERYRFNNATKELYEYSPEQQAYVFLKHSSQKELKALINENGLYI